MAAPTPNVNPTQLVRYVVQIDAMTDTDSMAQVRQHLTDLKLLVDRIGPGEVEVAVTHPNAPSSTDIKHYLQDLGFEVQQVTTQMS